MRKPIIVGNWKMNGSLKLIDEFAEKVIPVLKDVEIDCGIAAPHTMLAYINSKFGNDFIMPAQNMNFEEKGAFTGEISADMLVELGISSVIIGHSERRMYYGETDQTVNKKVHKACEKGFLPIICCGEQLEDRTSGKHFEVVLSQVEKAFKDLAEKDAKNTVIAYEPVWAIGTGKTATPEDAEEMCKKIRETMEKLYSKDLADNIRIQYGGSVKPSNVKEIMSMPNVDGALVGGAALKSSDFIELITYTKK